MDSILRWEEKDGYKEAFAGNRATGDYVSFEIQQCPTCYRRGQYRLTVEVCPGVNHIKWGCFDDQDQPLRWYHSLACAQVEAQHIADVLVKDRLQWDKDHGQH